MSKRKDSWQIEATNLERLRIVGPYSEGQECLTWLSENGYRTIRSGPYTDKEMHPRADIARFLYIAEREVETPPDPREALLLEAAYEAARLLQGETPPNEQDAPAERFYNLLNLLSIDAQDLPPRVELEGVDR